MKSKQYSYFIEIHFVAIALIKKFISIHIY